MKRFVYFGLLAVVGAGCVTVTPRSQESSAEAIVVPGGPVRVQVGGTGVSA